MEQKTYPVILTPIAIENVKKFQGDNPEGCLRLGVRGGGCSGFQYNIALDYPKDDDIIYFQEDVQVAIDPNSLSFLKGSTLDYKHELNSQGFQFENPNVVSSCGCNSSFRVVEGGCDAGESAI